jgi:hypothetical protein
MRPIDVIVSHGPSGSSRLQGRFILGGASHLDAFSGYLRLPSLPGVAAGATAGTRAGSSTRSSRTRVHAPQSSNAHSGYRPNCLTHVRPPFLVAWTIPSSFACNEGDWRVSRRHHRRLSPFRISLYGGKETVWTDSTITCARIVASTITSLPSVLPFGAVRRSRRASPI